MTKPQAPKKRNTRQMVHTERSILSRTQEVGECMEWKGYVQKGTPVVYHEGKTMMVRRLILELRGVNIPPKSFVVTKCDNPLCVNPDHIMVRTQKQHLVAMNKKADPHDVERLKKLMDFARKNRSKLTIEQVREIRASSESASALQKRYPVSKSRINRIKNGDAWRDMSSPFAGLMA